MTDKTSRKEKEIHYIRIMEAFEDNDIEFIEQLLSSPSISIGKILKMRDQRKRTPLHIVCQKGHLDLYHKVAKEHKKYGVSYDIEDDRGDTPLNLICSHGFDIPFDLDEDAADSAQQTNTFNKVKTEIIKDLIDKGANIRAACKKNKNTPLHWCVYYGNYEGGIAIFESFPLIILAKNMDKQTPLEILLHGNMKTQFKRKAFALVHTIVQNFSRALFEYNEDFILNNANKDEISKFKAIKEFKNKGQAFNDINLLAQLKRASMKNLFDTLLAHKASQVDGKYVELLDHPDLDKDKQDEKKSLLQDSYESQDNLHQDSELQKDLHATVKVYDEDKKNVLKNHYIIFLHKLLIIAVHVKDMTIVKLLIDNFNISPFVKSIDKLTAIHYAAMKGRRKILEFFLNIHYTYINSDRKFNIGKQINCLAGKEYDTCLHLAVKHNKLNVIPVLIEKGTDVNIFNFRDLRPLEMNRDSFYRTKQLELIIKEEYDNLIAFKDLTNTDSFNLEKLYVVRDNYIYFITAKDVQPDYQQSLVYEQLELLKNTWNNKIEIRYVEPLEKYKDNYYRFFFLIDIHCDLLDTMADYLDIEIYNIKRGYTTTFHKDSATEYIKFRDYHVHTIILHLLNNEFNINHFLKKGIIEQAFPLHEFKTRMNLKTNWEKEKNSVFFDPWKLKPELKDLRPFNSLAFYYGCDFAFYISFTTLYTSFLIILSFLGTSYYVWILISAKSLDNFITPIFALLISLWVTITLEKWKQKENEHAFIWNTLNYKENEIKRIDYKGNYAIDKVSKSLTVKDPFPTTKRRWIVRLKDRISATIIWCWINYNKLYTVCVT